MTFILPPGGHVIRLFVRCAEDGPPAVTSLDPTVKTSSDGVRRRTRRYFPGGPGGTRKNSERFRTQPITANEMEESGG